MIPIYILMLITFTINCTKSSDVTDTAVSIANTEFYQNDITLVIWSQSNHQHVTDFLIKYNGLTATLSTTEENVILALQGRLNFKQIVFFVESLQQFENYFDVTYIHRHKAIKAILIPTTELNIMLLAKIAWEHDVSDAVFLLRRDGKVTISTYFPFRNQEDCSNHTPVTLHSIAEVRDAFQKKYQNFQRCPLKSTLYNNLLTFMFENENGTVKNIRGPDAVIVNLILVTLNATMKVVTVDDNDQEKNGTIRNLQNSFPDFITRNSDIFFPAISLNFGRYKGAQISSVYKFLVIGWVAPKLPVVYPVGKILNPLFNNVTLFLTISFAIFVIVTKMIRKFQRNNADLKDNVLFDSYQIFLGQEAPFETKSSLLNSMFVMWIWFSTIVRLVYQSHLTSGLQTELSPKSFENFAEANKVIPDFGGLLVFKQFLVGTPLEKKYQVIPIIDLPKYYYDVLDGKKMLVSADVSSMYQGNMDMDIEVVKTPLATLGACYYMRPGWPGAQRFDTILKRIVEAGLVDKEFVKPKRKTTITTSETKPLKMKFLGVIFIGYLVLVLFCILVFVGEVIYYKTNSNVLFPYVN